MMRAMYSAIAGLQAHQTMLDVTANNLANVDTVGYKAQRTEFVDELSQQLEGASGITLNNGGTNPVQVGLGVQVGSIDNIMSQGAMEQTNNATDVAIQGDGYFRVANGAPPTVPTSFQYTRSGDMTFNTEGYMTTQNGMYVIGKNAVESGTPPNQTYAPGTTDSYIVVPPGSTGVSIGQDGSVTYVDENPQSATYQDRVTAGYISLATFPNEAGLERDGGSLWSQDANTGAPTVGTPGVNGMGATISGELEQSNVDMATEFTNMITAERGYQANSRAITTADDMLQTLVQMGQ